MSYQIDFVSIIILLGIVQGFYLAFILFHNRNGNYRANRYLAFLLCAVSISILNLFFIRTNMYHITSYTYKIPVISTLLFGPFIYFYARAIILPHSQPGHRDWVHFIPFLLVSVLFMPYLLKDKWYKYEVLTSCINISNFRYEQFELLFIVLFSQVQLWIYLFIVSRMLKEYQQTEKEGDSDIIHMNFNSLRFFISLFAVVYVTIFLLCISVLKYNYIITFSALGVVVSISIFILGYYLLKKNALFTLTPRKVTKPETVDLSEQTIHSLTQRLNKLMEEERLFTNPELNLNDLAKRLDISRNTLSQYLNICLKTNYNDYINRLRVEEMKLLLLDSNKSYLTIQALAQEAGFQSKTTYNRLFKQFTGVTPSEFKRGITTPENILSA